MSTRTSDETQKNNTHQYAIKAFFLLSKQNLLVGQASKNKWQHITQ